MNKTILLLLFLLSSDALRAAGDHIVSGTKAAGMGYASVAAANLWSTGNNPAGMAFTRGLQAGIYAENRFLVPELSMGTLAISYSCHAGAFGGFVSHFGGELYSELKVVAGYSRNFGKKFAAGLVFDYLHISQEEFYGNKSAVSFEAGLMYRPDTKWSLGIHVVNPVPVNLGSGKDEQLPVIFRAGFSKLFSNVVEVAGEIEKSLDCKPVIRAGLEYRLPRVLALRAGFSSQPQMITAGIGMVFGSLYLGLASSWQPELGYSPQAEVVWNIGKKQMTNDK